VVKPIDWARLTQGATDTYTDIDSLEQIRLVDERNRRGSRFPEGFPALYSPNWWALRRRYEELLGRRQRLARGGERWSSEDYSLSQIAKQVSLGDEPATAEYERINPRTGLHAFESTELRKLRGADPGRFEVISAEAQRLNAIGHPSGLPQARRM
jgi:hypothetical protein